MQVDENRVSVCEQVGYETIHHSEDPILKQDMPPALNRVEEASIFLLEASEMLRSDPYSAAARKKLIEGSRGLLLSGALELGSLPLGNTAPCLGYT